MHAARKNLLLPLAAAFVLWLAGGAGCDRGSPQGYDGPITAMDDLGQDIDYVSLAMAHLESLGPYDPVSAHQQLVQYLDQWMEKQRPDPAWAAEALLARLPSRLEPLLRADALTRRRFDSLDVLALQEALWLGKTSRRGVSLEADEPSVRDWLQPMRKSLDEASLEQLMRTARLFDWTVRNIQPDTEPGWQARLAGGEGPAYFYSKYFAWESLLQGHGDALVRNRIFILLARQQGIDVVMLGLDMDPGREPVPWLAAALIGTQLYLFDMDLGLPIPGPSGVGIATLEQVIGQPQLLAHLDLDDQHPYGVHESMLKRIVALVDGTPANLSQRMRLLEQAASP